MFDPAEDARWPSRLIVRADRGTGCMLIFSGGGLGTERFFRNDPSPAEARTEATLEHSGEPADSLFI